MNIEELNNTNPTFRSAIIAIIGRPNSGKSTLMNTLIGEQISIVTSLPQTTRDTIRGIYSSDSLQLVFVDTPGVHKGKHTLNNIMLEHATDALSKGGIDIVCYIVDLSREFGDEESLVAQLVENVNVPKAILFNKIDLCKNYNEIIQQFFAKFPKLSNIPHIAISAIQSDSQKIFLDFIDPFVKVGPQYYDPDSLTDVNMRFIAAEFIRKQIILHTREEVPHAVFVEIESYKEDPERHTVIATIHVETNGQRGIVVGKGGMLIKKIKHDAKKELQLITGVPVSLSCHIKVTPNWRDNMQFLRSMGMISKF